MSNTPTGPFKNLFEDGRPLINEFYNGAQPIDAHFFKDGDTIWLYYGGWGHLNVAKFNETLTGFLPVSEKISDIFHEITPKDYVEAPCVFKIGQRYHLMYSVGNWTDSSYRVNAAEANTPWGNFEYYTDVMKANDLAEGPGHNGIFTFKDTLYTAYHRRITGDTDSHHRVLCIDKLEIKEGRLLPVIMT